MKTPRTRTPWEDRSTSMTPTPQPYPAYKPSHVEWLGDVPAHWELVPLSAVSRLKSVTNQQDQELLSVYLDSGVIRFSDVSVKRTNPTSEDLSNYQAVDFGDFVLNNQQAWRGSVGVSRYKGIVSPAYLVLSLTSKFEPHFANLLLRERSMVGQYLVSSKGVGSIQRNLYWPHLKRVVTLVPPLPEQRAIVRYLDHVDDRIRRYVSAKQKLIAPAGGGAPGRHPPRRNPRPRPQRPPQAFQRRVARRRAGALGGAATCHRVSPQVGHKPTRP